MTIYEGLNKVTRPLSCNHRRDRVSIQLTPLLLNKVTWYVGALCL